MALSFGRWLGRGMWCRDSFGYVGRTIALTGPPPINIDFRNGAIGGSRVQRFVIWLLPWASLNVDFH